MQTSDIVVCTLFWVMMAASCGTCLGLCIAELVFHQPIRVHIPSVYWPVARLGFSPNRTVRRAFEFLFCNLYRKRFWNPLLNRWLKAKGFDRRRHLSGSNIHAACSALVQTMIVFSVYNALKVAALLDQSFWGHLGGVVWLAGFELIFNAPAIVLTRYLYLLTVRRPGLDRTTHARQHWHQNMA